MDSFFCDLEFGHRVGRDYLNQLFCDEDFFELKSGNLGTHSFRKIPEINASLCGLP